MRGAEARDLEQPEEWVVVARFTSLLGDADADMALSLLEANGISAVRFPTSNSGIANACVIGLQDIRVLVPPDRAEEAAELLKD